MLIVLTTLVLAASVLLWRSTRDSAAARQAAAEHAAKPIVYRDAPTVRVVESQRVGRLRKLIALRSGESAEVLQQSGPFAPTLRVTCQSIDDGATAALATARVHVELDGAQLSCGPLVREVEHNAFILQRAGRDEHRSAVFHFTEKDGELAFMRLKLRTVDLQARTAEFDVLYLRGHWPAMVD